MPLDDLGPFHKEFFLMWYLPIPRILDSQLPADPTSSLTALGAPKALASPDDPALIASLARDGPTSPCGEKAQSLKSDQYPPLPRIRGTMVTDFLGIVLLISFFIIVLVFGLDDIFMFDLFSLSRGRLCTKPIQS